jgi:hypothetical protein
MLHRSMVCLAGCVLSGCMHTGGAYPRAWPELVEVEPGACPAIDGEYADVGEMFRGIWGDDKFRSDESGYVMERISLTYLLKGLANYEPLSVPHPDFPESDRETDLYRSLSLRLTAGSLHVVATGVEGEIVALELPVLARCAESLVTVEPKSETAIFLVANMVDRYRIKLGRATDGSLLVHLYNSTGLTLMLAPILRFEERWMRFPQVAAQPALAAGADPAPRRAP